MPHMPRRKQQRFFPPATLLKFFLVLGALALLGHVLSAASGAGRTVGTVTVLVVVGVLIYFGALVAVRARDNRRLTDAIVSAIAEHRSALVRRRAQIRAPDAYGIVKVERWQKENGHFISGKIAVGLNAGQQRALKRRYAEIVHQIESQIADAAANHAALQSLPTDATPADFELFCAEQLRQTGWDAHVTKGSRDQGVDVIATKNGIRIILQCKLYSKPVGNKAVQEAAAGRLHEGARHAAVVSNRSYTSAAEELARTNGILLLHYSQLCELDAMLGTTQAEKAS
jgi:hypothetical protein